MSLSNCLSICIFVYLSCCLFGKIHVSLWNCMSICLFLYLSCCLFGNLHVSLSNCLSVYLSSCLFYLARYMSRCQIVCLSICLFVLSIWQDTCLVVKLSIKQLISLRPVNTFCNISFIFVVNLTNYKFWCLDCWLTKLSLNEDKCTKNVFLFHWS